MLFVKHDGALWNSSNVDWRSIDDRVLSCVAICSCDEPLHLEFSLALACVEEGIPMFPKSFLLLGSTEIKTFCAFYSLLIYSTESDMEELLTRDGTI